MSFDLGSQRHVFDIPDGMAYFNTAYSGPLLRESHRCLIEAAGAKTQPWTRVVDDFFADADRIRGLSADIFGGSDDHYAIIPAASYALKVAAHAIRPTLSPGDEIIVMGDEFPSNILPWRELAAQTGAQIVTIPMPESGDWSDAIIARLGSKVKLAALAHYHWTNGSFADLERIGEACAANGTILVLDMTQSLGAAPVDLARVKPDFLICPGYKWMLFPYGVGIMYVAERWWDSEPMEGGWLTRANAHDFANLMSYCEDYRAGARRFDIGETCTALLPGAIAALEQIKAWTVESVAESLSALNAGLAQRLRDLGFGVSERTPRHRHMFGARVPDDFDGDMVARLRQQNVFVSQRGRSIRFAPHLNVTADDVEHLFGAIESTLG